MGLDLNYLPEDLDILAQSAAKTEAVEREIGLRTPTKAFPKGHYRNDAEYVANYFGRIGGFMAGVAWALDLLKEKEKQ